MAGVASLTLSPTHASFTLSPTTPYHGQFEVRNNGDVSYQLGLRAAPFCISGDGRAYTPDFASCTDSGRVQLAHWLDLNATTYTDCDGQPWQNFADDQPQLAPTECLQIHYLINPPDTMPDGGQYGAVIMNYKSTVGAIQLTQEVAFRLFARAEHGQNLEQGTINRLSTPFLQLKAPLATALNVTNSGNVDFVIRQTYTVTNSFDKLFYEYSIDSTLYPDKTRELTLEWPDSPGLGLFQVTAKVQLCSGPDLTATHCTELAPTVTKTQTVIMLPLPLLITLISGVFLLVTFLVWRHRHHRRARNLF
jgi:hypothetical protein